jgi:quercetin dioxygenase-like cupin family protein
MNIGTWLELRPKLAIAATAVILVIAPAPAVHAQASLDVLATQTPDAMRFVADPAHAGFETAVLVGNPAGPGVYAVRTKLPAGITIAPHSHGEQWRIATVLSGTLYYAQGDTFDAARLKMLGPGSLIVEPRGIAHFAMTREEPVMLHIVGEGPASTDPVRK